METHELSNSRQQAYFLAIIDQICRRYAGSITSWIRSTERNKLVGGHPHSQHLTGTAVDIVLDDKNKQQEVIRMATQLGLVAMLEEDHIHIQLHRKKNETTQ